MNTNAYRTYSDSGDHYDSLYDQSSLIPGLIRGFTSTRNGKRIKILDAGSGTGQVSALILQDGINAEIYHQEPADGLRKVSEDRFADEVEKGIVKHSSDALPTMDYEDGMFDVVMFLACAHLVDDHKEDDVVRFDNQGRQIRPEPRQAEKVYPKLLKAFQETKRVLKPGGLFIVQSVLQQQYLVRWYHNFMPDRVVYDYRRTPDIEVMNQLFERAGFEDVEAIVDLKHGWAKDEYLRETDMFENGHGKVIDSTFSKISADEQKAFDLRLAQAKQNDKLENIMSECERNMRRLGQTTIFMAKA